MLHLTLHPNRPRIETGVPHSIGKAQEGAHISLPCEEAAVIIYILAANARAEPGQKKKDIVNYYNI